ncbi:hypothetical protein [Neisseria sp. Ec49-e6-T10]|uniref:hypothetical protein n=1 Tax=Neisseria sp. Ec49-e6-T10 TaxID=3140744 RepID=UPI003EBEC3A2
MKIYFSDFFDVTPECIEEYGAFNLSLINDLPLFIDPFLLFNSEKKEYCDLHQNIIKYVSFLKEVSNEQGITHGLLKAWFLFPEVKQNWFGYSKLGNRGSGLGIQFANALNNNLHHVFTDFGSENITKGSHLEKLCLIRDGVGKDNISDFTTNLIKGYLLRYTELFSKKYIKKIYLKTHIVSHVEFNYRTRSWISKEFILPTFNNDFVILTPKEILTKDETWINKSDMVSDFSGVVDGISNDVLRAQLNDYLIRNLPKDYKKKEYNETVEKAIMRFPEYIDYFIKRKEDTGNDAKQLSATKIEETENLFISKVIKLVEKLATTEFYNKDTASFEAAYQRVSFLKQIIENNDGYRFFYVKGKPIQREHDLQLLFRLTWFATEFDVNSEVNNGRGPVDYKISKGSSDKSLVEFKLASNSKLKQNIENQVKVYEQANQTKKSIKVILYFSDQELEKINRIFRDLKISESKNLVTIDARIGKISASNVR